MYATINPTLQNVWIKPVVPPSATSHLKFSRMFVISVHIKYPTMNTPRSPCTAIGHTMMDSRWWISIWTQSGFRIAMMNSSFHTTVTIVSTKKCAIEKLQ